MTLNAFVISQSLEMKQYIVDAFTDKVFHGNPAAICILDKWIDDNTMQNIAIENNLSETAFAVKEGESYHIRWFTPAEEINLCGHATLACSFVIMHFYEKSLESITYQSLSGILKVNRHNDLYELDFPAYNLKPISITQQMIDAIGHTPKEAYLARDLLCVFDNEEIIKNINPDLEKLKQIDGLLFHATAKGTEFDCISRSFAPKLNVVEDPVCGSGHCHIVPYWAQQLNKDEIVAYQASKRGGTLYCHLDGERVKMAGKAVLYSISDIFV